MSVTPQKVRKDTNDPRKHALAILYEVLEKGRDAQAVLSSTLDAIGRDIESDDSKQSMHTANRGLLTELVYGTLRNGIRLRWFAVRFLKNADLLPKEMLLALDIACYELFYLRIPARATIHSWVDIIKKRFGEKLGKVANGVLRNIQRNEKDFFDQSFYENFFKNYTESVACQFSLPIEVVSLWLTMFGKEQALELMKSSCMPAPLGLRFNLSKPNWNEQKALLSSLLFENNNDKKKIHEENLSNEPLSFFPVGSSFFATTTTTPKEVDRLEQQGVLSRQSGGAFEVLQAMNPKEWKEPIWDCCSGRGGKTCALLEMGIDVSVASDSSAKRIKELPSELVRLHLEKQPKVLHSSAIALSQKEGWKEKFGTVLIDAPCSGLGTLSRHPEIRYRCSHNKFEDLIALQKRLLEAGYRCLQKGGDLVYITCTLNPKENNEQMQYICELFPDLIRINEFQTPTNSPFKEFFYGVHLKKSLKA